MLNAAAYCSLFCPWTVKGTKAIHVNQLSNAADRAPVDINLALTSVTSATITIALQLQPLLDILISEEVQHLDSFTWVGQNKGNQQLWEYLLGGRKQQTMKRNWMQYVLGIPSQSHLCTTLNNLIFCKLNSTIEQRDMYQTKTISVNFIWITYIKQNAFKHNCQKKIIANLNVG